jgi:type II secretory pathway pseudopilin PulG
VSALTRVLVVLAVLGVLAYDGVVVAINQVSIHDEAQNAAQAGHEALASTKDAQAAYAAVLAYAAKHGETVVPRSFRVGAHDTVTVELSRSAPTLVLQVVPKVDEWVVARATAHFGDPIV